MRVSDLETPALVIDIDIAERNLARVADYARDHNLRLRPHTKTHKIPKLGRRQLDLGAAGLTVAKTTEAEVMLAAQPSDLLIAYPVIGKAKLDRLMRIAATTDVTVALDSEFAATELSAAAAAHGRRIGVLTEFDAGLHRVGVSPREELLALVKRVSSLPGLEFRGLTFYPGHIKDLRSGAEQVMAELEGVVSSAVEILKKNGFAVPIVSGGSTPTLFESHRARSMNEIRPGTYIFNDRNTLACGACAVDDCAASIVTTVVSTAVSGQIIIDGGSKTFSSDRCAVAEEPGFGLFPELPGAILTKMNEEHGFVDVRETGQKLSPGDRVRVIPNHICVAVNLHEQIYAVRGNDVVETWRVEGRGKLQ
jgi:D-serine deaminase-like pyridoxal phosphate-dependent protein